MITAIKKCVAVFKSRNQVMAFIETMNRSGVVCKMVATPKEARVGCGVSAEFMQSKVHIAKFIIKNGEFSSFVGIFLIEKRGRYTTTVRI